MEPWRHALVAELRRAGRVAVVGIGNPSRGDDAAGTLAARLVHDKLGPAAPKALVIAADEAPENFTGVVRAFAPDIVVLVDAAATGRPPGSVGLIEPASIADDDASTHRQPLGRLVRYLEGTMACRTLVLGIEPCSFEGPGLSPAVGRAVRTVVAVFVEALAAAD